VNGFLDHLYTRLVSTSNYSATANLHNLQITTAAVKPFPPCCVFNSRSLATASNSEDFSASRAQILSPQPPVQNSLTTESESYVTTDGQSASLSWYKAPIRGLRPDFFFFCRSEYGIRLTVMFFIPWDALSDERTGLSFVCAAGPCQRSLSQVLIPWDLSPCFTVLDLRLPFSSPPTTRRITVEVFDPASTRVSLTTDFVPCL
jgi:hypothetical protein